VALMAWAFSTYLILKGLKKIWKFEFHEAALIGFIIAIVVYFVIKPLISKQANKLKNDKPSINKLFTIPLIFAAALLSFAHGANDVANAVGPLAAINAAIVGEGVATKAAIPIWVMMIGALGIAIGLALYGPKLIRTVGTEITELDQSRAFCIAMAASITVIFASQLGLPVSSTHIAVGAVFGVGFLREFIKSSYAKMIDEIKRHHIGKNQNEVDAFLQKFNRASVANKGLMLKQLKRQAKKTTPIITKEERKALRKVYRKDLVKRSAFIKIIAAWVITVPMSGLMAAMLFFTIRGIMLP